MTKLDIPINYPLTKKAGGQLVYVTCDEEVVRQMEKDGFCIVIKPKGHPMESFDALAEDYSNLRRALLDSQIISTNEDKTYYNEIAIVTFMSSVWSRITGFEKLMGFKWLFTSIATEDKTPDHYEKIGK